MRCICDKVVDKVVYERPTDGLVRLTCLLKARWSLFPTSTLGMPGACSSTSFTHLQQEVNRHN